MAITLGAAAGNRQVSRIIERFQDRYPKAVARALNRAGTSARALMGTLVAKDVGIKTGAARDQIKIDRATDTRHVVRLSITGKRIPLIEFRAKGPEPSRGRGRGVTAKLPGGAGRYPHAFIATVGTGRHRGVFVRVGASTRVGTGAWGKNLPIKELRGPSLPKVFEKFTPEGLARGQASLVTNLRSELRFALGGGSASADSAA